MARIGIIIVASAQHKKNGSGYNKFLLRVNNNTTVLRHQIQTLKEVFGKADILLITGFGHKDIYKDVDYEVPVIENDLWEITSVVRSIALALRILQNDKILIIPSSLLFSSACFKNIENVKNGLIISNNDCIDDSGLGILVESKKIRNIDYTFKLKWSQISFFSGKALKTLKELCELGFEQEELHRILLHEIINKMIESGCDIAPVMNRRSKVIEINSQKDIEKVGSLRNAYTN